MAVYSPLPLVRLHHRGNFDDATSLESPAGSSNSYGLRSPAVSTTPTLTPTSLSPERLNKSAEAAVRLKHVDWVEVVAVETALKADTPLYEIRLFLTTASSQNPTSRLPTNYHAAPLNTKLGVRRPLSAVPHYRVRHHLAEFQALRHALENTTEQPHHHHCQLCNDFQTKLTFSRTRLLMALGCLLPHRTRVKALNAFLREMLNAFQRERPPRTQRHRCHGTKHIPVQLHDFFFPACDAESYP